MKHMLKSPKGFALPTILIASVIMLILLLSAVTAVSSITGGLNSQYYNQLAREAAESGLANAETCLRVTDYTPSWTNASPLKPDTNCAGTPQGSYSKWVVETTNLRTSFTVPQPEVGISSSLRVVATGTVELKRSSDPNDIWRTYTVTVAKNSRYNDMPQIAGAAGWKDTGHNGYMLASSGVLYGWGDNTANQLGPSSLGTIVSIPLKIALPDGVSRAKRVFNSGQGASILCIMATHQTLGDQLYCRGNEALLGGGDLWQRIVLPAGLTATSRVDVNGYGTNNICLVASDSQVYCVGDNIMGSLGTGTTIETIAPFSAPVKFRLDLANPGPVSGSAASLTAKEVFMKDRTTCVIASDNQAYCAGRNDVGQLGHGNTTTNVGQGMSIPGRAVIPGNPPVDKISLPYHAASIDGIFYHTIGSGVYMSGYDGLGTADDSTINGSVYSTPKQITSGEYPVLISVGEEGDQRHSICVIGATGFYCMGQNKFGQIGLGSCTTRSVWTSAINLGGGQTASTILNKEAMYQMNSVMVITTPAGDVYAAGDNTYGKLGTGTAYQACNPNFTRVLLPTGVKATAVAAGDEYTAFILGDNGKVYAMGRNNNGQLGNGTTTNSNVPVEVKIPRQETVY